MSSTFFSQETHHLRQLSVLSVTILNISSGIGRCFAGFFADRIGPTNALFIVILMSGLAQLLVWNFVSDYPGIVSVFKQDMDLLGLTCTDGYVGTVRLLWGLLLVLSNTCRFVHSLDSS